MANLQRQSKEVEERMGRMRAAARGLVVPALPQPQGDHETTVAPANATAQVAQPPQISSMVRNHPAPAEEAQPSKQPTRSSGRGSQSNKNTPAKRRKTADNLVVSSQEAVFLDEDVDMVPESQGQVSIFSDTIIAQTEITLRQVTKVFRVQEQLLEISSIDTCTSSHTETCRRVDRKSVV